MTIPSSGDVIIRCCTPDGSYLVVDASTDAILSAVVPTIEQAVALAKERGAVTIWLQHIDQRGRPLGPPTRWD